MKYPSLEKHNIQITNFNPYQYAMDNICPNNKQYVVINGNSAVMLDIIVNKPAVDSKYADIVKEVFSSSLYVRYFALKMGGLNALTDQQQEFVK